MDDAKCLAKPGQNCGTMCTLYCISCKGCKADISPEVHENPSEPGGVKHSHYLGMTAGSCHNRWKTHRENHDRKDKSSALHQHDVSHHNGVKQMYKARVVSREVSLLTLSVKEALLQEHQHLGTTINDRIEMGRRGGLIRIAISRSGVT